MGNIFKIVLVSIFLGGCTNLASGNNPSPAPTTTGSSPSPSSSGEKVDFLQVKTLITEKCAYCHSINAKEPSWGNPAGGVAFDTNQQIKAKADRIKFRAVVLKDMPLMNKTKITQAERDLLGKWVDSGAPIE
jgi:uncharacterized membrane protein